MIRGLISTCLSRRPLVLIAFAAFLALGFGAFQRLNIEAYPDPAPPIIEIIAQYPGQSPEEVERYVTIPIEIAVASTPGLKFIRSNTVYALGFIRLQFEYGRDYYFVRQQALNRLKDVELPPGVQPVISPAGTISEIFRYQLNGPPGMDLIELKTLQDWVVERRLRIVPGVADVLVLGGKTKEFQAEIDLNRMMAYGLTLPQIITAIAASNANVGGRTISLGEQSVNVRGLGVLTSLEDIGNIVLTQQGGVPVLLSDVAKIQIGFTPRLGIAGRDDTTDIVFGIVLMQKFERTMEVVTRVRAAVAKLNTDGSLPPGVQIEPFYDRGDLVAVTVHTVLHNMLFGIALIFLIQWLFLGNLRCALIVAATIPVALFLAVIITVLRGESANLLSVGAIDLGIIVDAHRDHGGEHLPPSGASHPARDRRSGGEPGRQAPPHADRRGRGRQGDLLLGHHHHRGVPAAVHHAGRRGPDFRPDGAHLCLCAARRGDRDLHGDAGDVLGAAARARSRRSRPSWCGSIRNVYLILLPLAVRQRPDRGDDRAGVPDRSCGVLGARLGTEFLPKLEEGNLWIRALLPPTITLEAGMETVARIRNIIMELRAGADGRLRAGPRRGRHRSRRLVRRRVLRAAEAAERMAEGPDQGSSWSSEMSEQLNREFVGVDFNFSQYIQDNIEEAVSGVKGENSVKIFGRDLAELERLSKSVKAEIGKVPGVINPAAFNLLGQPNLVVRIDRAKAARYGFSVGDINAVVQAAIGGQEVTRVYEGEIEFRAHGAARAGISRQRRRHPLDPGRACRTAIRRRRPPISRSATSAR